MTNTCLTIYGASDDLLEVDGPGGTAIDEFGAYGPNGCTILIEAPMGERLWVRAVFDADQDLRGIGGEDNAGGWCLSVLHVDTDTAWTWPVFFSFRPGRIEDPALIVECPEGTTVREWTEDDRVRA